MTEHKIIEGVARPAAPAPRQPIELRGWLLAIAATAAVFGVWLVELFRFAAASTLYSHIPLIPFVSAWLVWQRRHELPARANADNSLATAAAVVSALAIVLVAVAAMGRIPMGPETLLSLKSAAFVLAVLAVTAWWQGRAFVRAARFPLAFLVFMVPIPESLLSAIETFLQHGSAFVARGLFATAGTSVFYQSLTFQLPGINLHVAPECSGIHSTLALLMVSLLAGHAFLRSSVRAGILAAAVLPLALLRNGFRIFVVGELCVEGGPQMINSPIHRQGGPLFFALSLIPFLGLLALLVASERRAARSAAARS